VVLLGALLDGAPLPPGRFRPDPWPALPANAAPDQPAFDELVAVA
jgi:hypothetical protein